MNTQWIKLTLSSSFLTLSIAAAQTPSFEGVGTMNPAAGFYSDVAGISGDGQYVIGRSISSYDSFAHFDAYRWNRSTGFLDLGAFVPDQASYNGSVVFGHSAGPLQWTAAQGIVPIPIPGGPSPTGYFTAISSDGSAASGNEYTTPIRWTAAGGPVDLGPMPTYTTIDFGIPRQHQYEAGYTHDISGDGQVIVGTAGFVDMTGAPRSAAFRWTTGTGAVDLGALPGQENSRTEAFLISADGKAIVGTSGVEVFRWTQQTGMMDLGFSNGGSMSSSNIPIDISGDGSVLLTSSSIWDSTHGLRSLTDFLHKEHGLNLSGWSNLSAVAMSDSGTTIVGNGIDPQGFTEGWIAAIPEPGTAFLMMIGVLMLGVLLYPRRAAR